MDDPTRFSLASLMEQIERATGCDASFHDLSGVTLEVPALKLPARFHAHHGPYCEAVKLAGGQVACAEHKAGVNDRGSRETGPFFRICPRGMEDLVVPVRSGDDLLGCLYLEIGRASCRERV